MSKAARVGRSAISRPKVDWLKSTSIEGGDVFLWVDDQRVYGWLFERVGGTIRPYNVWWDNFSGDIKIDLIPRITVLEYSHRINSIAILAEQDCHWPNLDTLPNHFGAGYISPPSDLKELCFQRRKALDRGVLIENECKAFRKSGYERKLETLELMVLRNNAERLYPPALRYLVGVCEALSQLGEL